MPVYDTYLKRKQQLEKAGQPDIWEYEALPLTLRTQIVKICQTTIGIPKFAYPKRGSDGVWNFIHETLCREFGVFYLAKSNLNRDKDCYHFLLHEEDIVKVLSLIEMAFRCIERLCPDFHSGDKTRGEVSQEPDDAINELNIRFKEHGIGYQYAGGIIIRVDSQYVHSNIVLPAISLLQQPGFEGASEEFLNAHKHYREGNNKGAISEALKAFESTMKSICAHMGWEVHENATAKPLIEACITNGLIPKPLTSHFNSLRTTLESGLPTLSNRTSRHGQGKKPVKIPDHVAAYALHLAATNIVFLVESYMKIKS